PTLIAVGPRCLACRHRTSTSNVARGSSQALFVVRRVRPRQSRTRRPSRGDFAFQGAVHVQLTASLKLPVPLYFAYCGYGQSGRDSADCAFAAVTWAGATPF